MKERNLTFEKKIDVKNGISERHRITCCEYLLNDNGSIFDPEYDYNDSKKIRALLSERYLKFFKNLCRDDHVIVVRISGIGVDLVELIKTYTFSKTSRNNAIFHYHHWNVDCNGAVDEDAYMLIKCDNILFQKLFREYWFSIGVEYHFEGFVLKAENIRYIEKWSRLDNDDSKKQKLISKSFIAFDNFHNGFHFQVCTDKKKQPFFKNCEP